MLVYFGTGGSAEGLVKAQEGTEGAARNAQTSDCFMERFDPFFEQLD